MEISVGPRYQRHTRSHSRLSSCPLDARTDRSKGTSLSVPSFNQRQAQSASDKTESRLRVQDYKGNSRVHREVRPTWISVPSTTSQITIVTMNNDRTNVWYTIPSSATISTTEWIIPSTPIWETWNNISTTSTIIWDGWNRQQYTRGTGMSQAEVRLHQERAEEDYHRVEEHRAAIRLRRMEQEKVQEKARVKAEALLHEYLSEEQIKELEETGGFVVLGSLGTPYTIRRGYQGNVRRDGYRYCAHGPHDIPVPDHMLMQKLAIETDEEAFLAVANRSLSM